MPFIDEDGNLLLQNPEFVSQITRASTVSHDPEYEPLSLLHVAHGPSVVVQGDVETHLKVFEEYARQINATTDDDGGDKATA